MSAADEVDDLVVVVYGDIFSRLSLAFVKFAGELLQVHIEGIGPWAEKSLRITRFYLLRTTGWVQRCASINCVVSSAKPT